MTMCVCGHEISLHHGSPLPGHLSIPDGQCSGCDCADPRPRPSAREKAVEALAAELHDATNAGVIIDRVVGRVPMDVARRHARELLDQLNLVAIDPALVERIREREAERRDYGAYSELADTVIEQVKR